VRSSADRAGQAERIPRNSPSSCAQWRNVALKRSVVRRGLFAISEAAAATQACPFGRLRADLSAEVRALVADVAPPRGARYDPSLGSHSCLDANWLTPVFRILEKNSVVKNAMLTENY